MYRSNYFFLCRWLIVEFHQTIWCPRSDKASPSNAVRIFLSPTSITGMVSATVTSQTFIVATPISESNSYDEPLRAVTFEFYYSPLLAEGIRRRAVYCEARR